MVKFVVMVSFVFAIGMGCSGTNSEFNKSDRWRCYSPLYTGIPCVVPEHARKTWKEQTFYRDQEKRFGLYHEPPGEDDEGWFWE
ncbi:MAG: hypothetical protein CMP10_03015 [Zetaproteobacteria bacterium]|nr:hypothetical protein [Pseudobdellovibrionaceae bacterium]|tara:strand:+ start:275 stop:526 length:252 start_codon:yes stop_codon:yes gene_type:complete